VVIGQNWEDDVRIVLFVKLADGIILTEAFAERIKQHIRTHASPRHVPAKILQVKDIPKTLSGKVVETAVREIVHHRPIQNIDSLANPEALEEFKNRSELSQ
jgi:acetoacetyl-CoA synthetase